MSDLVNVKYVKWKNLILLDVREYYRDKLSLGSNTDRKWKTSIVPNLGTFEFVNWKYGEVSMSANGFEIKYHFRGVRKMISLKIGKG